MVKAFVIRYPSSGAQSIQDFYDTYSAKKKIYDSFRRHAKDGNAAAAMRLAELDRSAFVQLDGVREALSTMSQVIRLVDKNPEMSADDKRQIIDSVYFRMIEVAKAGNAVLKEADAAFAGH